MTKYYCQYCLKPTLLKSSGHCGLIICSNCTDHLEAHIKNKTKKVKEHA